MTQKCFRYGPDVCKGESTGTSHMLYDGAWGFYIRLCSKTHMFGKYSSWQRTGFAIIVVGVDFVSAKLIQPKGFWLFWDYPLERFSILFVFGRIRLPKNLISQKVKAQSAKNRKQKTNIGLNGTVPSWNTYSLRKEISASEQITRYLVEMCVRWIMRKSC